ncbi:MAG: hypothetical protein JWO41_138 [Candidatus Saccharibacteria bacterium]|nr:hypothetical protein [Candidatus Saccharibacteria bacterium]
MKRFILSLLVMFSTLSATVVATVPAYAVNVTPGCSSGALGQTDVCQAVNTQSKSSQNPIVSLIGSIINILSYVVGAAAVIGLIVAGLRMMLSSGDSSAIANARSSIVYCIVGVVVAVVAQAIVIFVINNLGK